jgi:DNA-binding GntR family transcriptional regulator
MARKPERAADNGARNSRRLSDIAYSRILENLFDGQLPAGAFVSQNDLVMLLGIPVGPLRDALRVLEAEGVLRIHPRSGIEFVKPGLELTRSTYQFRTIIERAAVRIFAERAPFELLKELRAEHEALIARLVSGEIDNDSLRELERLEGRLHNSIVGIMTNPLIESSYRRMHNYLRLVRLDRRLTAPLALRSLDEHMQIIDACIARDADRAEAAVRAHFTEALQRHMGIA